MSDLGDLDLHLPPPDADQRAVAAWVTAWIVAADDTPHNFYWRHKSVGNTLHEIIADTERHYRVDFRVPAGEMRMITAVSTERDLGVRAYVRRAVGTVLVACDGLDPSDVPGLLGRGGLVRPR